MAGHLGGETKIIRLYDAQQGYFNYTYNQEWIDLVSAARHVIFPVPMWNFTIPAALKDFFDKITQRGRVWDFDHDKNYVGLFTDKSAWIIMTSGDYYSAGSPNDFVIPYLRVVLAFVGIRDVHDFRLGGVRNKNLAADKHYMEDKTREMLKALGLKN